VIVHEEPTPEYLRILKGLPGAAKLHASFQLYWSARKLKASFLRRKHPSWTDEEIEAEVKRIFQNATT